MWLRMRQIALVAHDLEKVLADFDAVLGLEVCFVDPGVKVFGLRNSLMPVGNQFIEVVSPIQEGTTGGRYLERRGGDGGYMAIFQCDEHAPVVARVEHLGVRKVTTFENDEYRCMQLHPKDTGGSFLEIDEQKGPDAHDVDGPWDPAGGHGWKKAQRLDVVRAITAAELQCDEPEATAARWGEIMQVPVTRDADGAATLVVQDARVRFVAITDGRPEGLSGIEVACNDRARAIEAARSRGLLRGDDTVEICGMRIRLV